MDIHQKKILKKIYEGDVSYLEDYLRYNPKKHWKDIRYEAAGDTILHISSRLGFTNIVEYLLNNFNPKAVDCRNNDNKTALHEAAQFAQYDTAKILLESGADVNALKKADWTPIMLACTKVQNEVSFEVVKLLLEHKAAVNYPNKDGWTALHLISREGSLKILNLLITYNIDINRKTRNGRSALHVAVLHRNTAIFNRLIGLGLNIECKDLCGNGPIHEAVLSSDIDVFKCVVGTGCNYISVNNEGYTILHLAASVAALDIIEYIVKVLHVNVNSCTNNNVTPLHCAARKNMINVYNLLLELGADESIKDVHMRVAKDYLNLC